MIRIDLHSKMPRIPTEHEGWKTQSKHCRRWLQQITFEEMRDQPFRLPRLPAENRHLPTGSTDQIACTFFQLEVDLHRANDGRCGMAITCEDKDPNILWRCGGKSLLIRWFAQLQCSKRWIIEPLDKGRVLEHYRANLDKALPSCLQTGRTTIALSNLPYAYPSIKKKCHRHYSSVINGLMYKFGQSMQGATHTCRKVGRSCYRNICSFAKIPCRKQYRHRGRILEFLTRTHRPSYDLPDTTTAPEIIMHGYQQQLKRPTPNCYKCISCGKMMTKANDIYKRCWPGIRVDRATPHR